MFRKIFLLCFVFISFGCSNNDRYSIEKRFWQARVLAEKVFKNPAVSPPRESERAVLALSDFSLKYKGSNFAIESDFLIARLYTIKQDFENARNQLRSLLAKYEPAAIKSEALFLLGYTYELEGKWELALEKYKQVIRDYPEIPRGINLPIYIAHYYKKKYQPEKMVSAYQEAITHYKGLAQKYLGAVGGLNFSTLVAQCYVELKDWQNVINTYSSIIENYKDKVMMDGLLMQMAVIYKDDIKDLVKAKELLERVVKEYPKSRFAKSAGILLKEMEK